MGGRRFSRADYSMIMFGLSKDCGRHNNAGWGCCTRPLSVMISVYVEWEDGMSVCMGVCTWMTVKCVRVAQWIRRPPTKREIAGSSPVVDYLFFLMHRHVSRNPGFESQSPPSFLTLFHISITNIPTHEFRRYIVSFTLFPLYTARMQPDISTIQTLSVCSQNIQHVVYTKRTWTLFT